MRTRSLAAVLCTAGAMLAGTAGADANVRVGTSGWQWGNPDPTGSTINTIGFSGARGYAGGAFGTLIRTDDGGANWTGLPTGLLTPLTELQVITPDAFVVGGGCAARRSVDGGATFTRLYFNSLGCKEELTGLSFSNVNTGYLVLEDGTIVGSTDGGATWSPKTAVPGSRAAGGNATPTDIAFTSDTVGFVSSTQGRIYKTTDGGGSWTQVNDTNRSVNDLTFVDANTGFAVGASGLFLETTDGGTTWVPKNTGADGSNLTTVRAVDASNAIATNEKGDFLLRTTDKGATFSRVSAMTQATNTVGYSSATRVVAAGNDGALAASNDGGATFTTIGNPRLSGQYFVIRSAPGGAAFATGENGGLARTTDGGQTWTKVGVPTSEDILDVSFPTAQIGYAIDTDGKLFKSTNTGTSWANLDTGTTAKPGAVYAPSASVVILVGPTGVRRSGNGADSFTTVKGAVAKAKLDDYDDAGSSIIVWGRTALLRSGDKGKTWKSLKLPTKKTKVAGADFVTANTGFLRDTGGRLWKTTNGGKKWTEVQSVGSTEYYGMSFSSATSGYLVTSEFGNADELGYLLRTTDGGKTWAPQLVTDAEIKGYGIAAGATSYVLAGTNSLLFSTTGGQAGKASSATLKASKTKLKKKARIQVTITVKGAKQGDVAVVSGRKSGGSWTQQQVELDRSGKATTSWNVTNGTTTFVGQWAGNEASAGDGSPPVTVKVGK
ncbi:YCF48-related protein [Svornostia abyssi]|uniref:YCF48-related protein n=1 Tax=Svornostia abyssi TaxID=2898438 RepID=A0ABY5PK97_9ACTN|nr:YCF48-related protein [Parviterribacteraceae bacterium J379]